MEAPNLFLAPGAINSNLVTPLVPSDQLHSKISYLFAFETFQIAL